MSSSPKKDSSDAGRLEPDFIDLADQIKAVVKEAEQKGPKAKAQKSAKGKGAGGKRKRGKATREEDEDDSKDEGSD